jgi:L-ribulose-5-phosphate 3-epimerase
MWTTFTGDSAMKKGVNCWTLPHHLSDLELLKLAKNAGFDGIELSITAGDRLNVNSTDSQLAAINTAAADIGISIHSISCSLNWQCSLTSNFPSIRQKAKDHIKKQIHFAAILGADSILTLPGFVGVDFSNKDLFTDIHEIEYAISSEIIDYDIAWDRSIEAYRELSSVAEQYNIKICIENIWNKFLLSPLEMRRFIDEIGSDFVRVYLDVGNIMPYGYPEQWIKILGSRVAQVHFKDYKRGLFSLASFVDLLSGDVDFTKVRAALEAIGYDGWVTAETSVYKQYPEQAVWNASAALDRILGR